MALTKIPASMAQGLVNKSGDTINGRILIKDTTTPDGPAFPFGVQNGSNQPWWLHADGAGELWMHRNGWGDAIGIDTQGRFKTPSQPHYSAGIGHTSGHGGNGAANLFWGMTQRGGLSYNGDRITVPVAGVYLITWVAIALANSTRQDSSLQINGTTYQSCLSEDSTYGYHQRSHVISIALAANDYIQFWHSDWYNGGPWSTISVTLLG